jgi:hypothetical protein
MRSTRRVWWKAAGLVLVAASPALAQTPPEGGAPPEGVPDGSPPAAIQSATGAAADVLADVEVPQAPRPAVMPQPAPSVQPAPAGMAVAPAVGPASKACSTGCAPADRRWFWQRWLAPKHADCQAHMWGYPQEFEAPPLGASVHANFRTMVANGEAAAMVLYRYDFIGGTDVLNLHGRDQLTKIAALLRGNDFPIIIERTPEAPAVAEARRAVVLNVLAHNNIAIPPERIVIGPPIATGLSGRDAEAIAGFQIYTLRTQSIPPPIPTLGAGVSGGGFGGGGFGGGGLGAGVGGGIR